MHGGKRHSPLSGMPVCHSVEWKMDSLGLLKYDTVVAFMFSRPDRFNPVAVSGEDGSHCRIAGHYQMLHKIKFGLNILDGVVLFMNEPEKMPNAVAFKQVNEVAARSPKL
jgi:hypothetical protein